MQTAAEKAHGSRSSSGVMAGPDVSWSVDAGHPLLFFRHGQRSRGWRASAGHDTGASRSVQEACAGADLAGAGDGGVGNGACCVASWCAAWLMPAVTRALNTTPTSNSRAQTASTTAVAVRSFIRVKATRERGGSRKCGFTDSRSQRARRSLGACLMLGMRQRQEAIRRGLALGGGPGRRAPQCRSPPLRPSRSSLARGDRRSA